MTFKKEGFPCVFFLLGVPKGNGLGCRAIFARRDRGPGELIFCQRKAIYGIAGGSIGSRQGVFLPKIDLLMCARRSPGACAKSGHKGAWDRTVRSWQEEA
ncbi:hypothetical protein MPNT_10207 [Candidatus Methylacidithermus pantelleriae]|uniref:Uncharacterized protein n=1 Tax=Candidatus Methylacidithermus pantelleriae TaxID=2744239 RepID=A0A8J2BK86_9BACT|nr:hypothetical protein MPNT_10207 [Candidatus Methylacidithermus pantelleriae]